MKSYLNLGCGDRFHPAWTNVDYAACDPTILSYNLRGRFPFADEQFDIVYHSHLLEHFPRSYALPFLRECHRVLKPEGIIRIATPDLERLVRIYLKALEESVKGDEQWQRNYEWILIALYDQTVREQSGGEMAAYLQQPNLPNKEFVLEQHGVDARRLIDEAERRRSVRQTDTLSQSDFKGTRRGLSRFLRNPSALKELLIRFLLGGEYELLQVGRFRHGGEPHLWMYDRYSLMKLLGEAGFNNPRSLGAAESQIPNWINYNLDTEPDGAVYKPDSLFVEARK